MSQTAIKRHHWSRAEYDHMIAAGVFHSEVRLELIDGEIINVTLQGSLHATAVQLAADILRQTFSEKFTIRVQLPIALEDSSEPEPDIAVVIGVVRDYRDAHPTSAMLVVEVSDATLSYDRQQKKKLYARTGIPEYWIVNLKDEQVEVFCDPQGEGYAQEIVFQPTQFITLLANPKHNILVADLLP